jgi:dipeptidyl-peptidase-3
MEVIAGHLEAAIPFATEPMVSALRTLSRFDRTVEDAASPWVQDFKESPVDTINGFLEVYVDARSIRCVGRNRFQMLEYFAATRDARR